MPKIVIIGNGVAGTNAARHIRKLSDNQIVMISEETLKPFSRTALMYVFMGHVKQESTELYEDWFWEKNRIERVQTRVESIDAENKILQLSHGQSMTYDKLIIAVGSKSNKFGWRGQDLKGVHGLYHLQDMEAMERYSKGLKRAVVVGGGLIGIEMAEMFASRGIAVTFLVREKSFWDLILPAEESAMINRHILEHHIDLRLGTELDEIIGDENGVVKAITTKSGERIECGFVGLTVGVSPNVVPTPALPKGEGAFDLPFGEGRSGAISLPFGEAGNSLPKGEGRSGAISLPFGEGRGGDYIEVGRGYLVDEYLTTSNPDVYAIGDCAELRRPQQGRRAIEAVWYTGRMMGQTVARTVCGQPTKYEPRLWFNSAKFFDIEYQVYGDVLAKNPEGVTSLYWEHQSGKKAIRVNFSSLNPSKGGTFSPPFGGTYVTGFNLMGIRYRHEVCEKWILERTPIETVLEHLSLANFDPEFFDEYEKEFVHQYNQLTGSDLRLKAKRRLSFVGRFLARLG